MKKWFLLIVTGVFATSTTFASTMVEEVSYDQLVKELRTKKSQAPKSRPSMPSTYNLGLGIVNSSSNYEVAKTTGRPSLMGVEINASAPVYEKWNGVGQVRLFSANENGGISASAREVNGKLLYMDIIDADWSFQVGPGTGIRMSELSERNGASASPFAIGLLLEGGVGYQINQTVKASANIGARSAVGAGNDKGSFDIGIGISTKL